jgi:hypothetical protein
MRKGNARSDRQSDVLPLALRNALDDSRSLSADGAACESKRMEEGGGIEENVRNPGEKRRTSLTLSSQPAHYPSLPAQEECERNAP